MKFMNNRVGTTWVCKYIVPLGIAAPLLLSADVTWAADVDENALEEIIVSAQRRDQKLQDVPISISVLNETKLERMGIDNFTDYITAIPGISFNFSQGNNGGRFGSRTIGIRGVQRFGSGTASTVGFYIDETSVDIANPRIFDTARIEALRGPQGTIYGSGSVGGTIRIITNQPDTQAVSGRVNATYSGTRFGGPNFNTNTVLNIPIVKDMFAVRIVSMYRKEGGYVDDVSLTGELEEKDINDVESNAFRVSARLEATERLAITSSVYWQREQHAAESFWSYDVPQTPDFPKFSRTQLEDTSTDEKFTLANFTINYAFDKLDLVSTTSYFKLNSIGHEDQGGVVNVVFFGDPLRGIRADTDVFGHRESWTHESRLVSRLDGPFQFVTGLYYEDGTRSTDAFAIAHGLNDAFGAPILPVVPQGENIFITLSERKQEQIALFGEATYSVTPQIDFTAGVRWFQFKSSTSDAFTGFFFPNVAPLAEGSAKENGINPKFTVQYKPTDDLMLYSTVSKGFRPGNANFPLPLTCNASLIAAGITPPGADKYESDDLWNYEAGAKSSWFDNRLIFNATGYYMEWKDLQLVVPLSSCGGISGYITNAGAARSVGAEFELMVRPVEGLVLGLDGAYVDSEITESGPSLGNSVGQDLPNISNWTGSANAQYTFPISNDFKAYVRSDARYRSKSPMNLANTLFTDSYVQLDARAGMIFSENWEVSLFVQNLTDEAPRLVRGNRLGVGGFGFDTISLRPRTIGIKVEAAFD